MRKIFERGKRWRKIYFRAKTINRKKYILMRKNCKKNNAKNPRLKAKKKKRDKKYCKVKKEKKAKMLSLKK